MCFWRDRGFCYGKKGEDKELKEYAKKLCDWLDKHLAVYAEKFQKEMEPVEGYIKECISYFEKWMAEKKYEEKSEEIKRIRKSYQYAGLDTDDEMYNMIDCIGEAWKRMASWEGKEI